MQNINDQTLENRFGGQMSSKTSGTKKYVIKIGYANLTIIDTPGFGDTRSVTLDDDHLKIIKEAVTTEQGINCVCVV